MVKDLEKGFVAHNSVGTHIVSLSIKDNFLKKNPLTVPLRCALSTFVCILLVNKSTKFTGSSKYINSHFGLVMNVKIPAEALSDTALGRLGLGSLV